MAEAATKAPEQVPVEQERNVVSESFDRMRSRLERLRPLRDEANEIEKILDVAQPVLNGEATEAEAKPQGEAQDTTTTTPRRRRRSRRHGRGQARDEFVRLVKENPGSKVADIAKLMGIAPNYLYRVLPQVKGEVTKQGDGTLVPKS